MEAIEIIQFIVDQTNQKLKSDIEFADYFAKKKTVLLEFTDTNEKHAFRIDQRLAEIIDASLVLSPDIFIKTDTKTFYRLLNGQARPIKQIASGKLYIKAGMKDMMMINKIMNTEGNTISGVMSDFRSERGFS